MALMIILIIVISIFCALEIIGLVRAIKKARDKNKSKEKEVNNERNSD